jgi:hypothetical protein
MISGLGNLFDVGLDTAVVRVFKRQMMGEGTIVEALSLAGVKDLRR